MKNKLKALLRVLCGYLYMLLCVFGTVSNVYCGIICLVHLRQLSGWEAVGMFVLSLLIIALGIVLMLHTGRQMFIGMSSSYYVRRKKYMAEVFSEGETHE